MNQTRFCYRFIETIPISKFPWQHHVSTHSIDVQNYWNLVQTWPWTNHTPVSQPCEAPPGAAPCAHWAGLGFGEGCSSRVALTWCSARWNPLLTVVAAADHTIPEVAWIVKESRCEIQAEDKLGWRRCESRVSRTCDPQSVSETLWKMSAVWTRHGRPRGLYGTNWWSISTGALHTHPISGCYIWEDSTGLDLCLCFIVIVQVISRKWDTL